MGKIFNRSLFFGLLAMAIVASSAAAQEKMDVSTQVETVYKGLRYIKSHQAKSDGFFTLGVLNYAKVDKALAEAAKREFSKHDGETINGKKFKTLVVDFDDTDQLDAKLKSQKVDAVFIPVEHDAILPRILAVTREADILSTGGDEDYVRRGASMAPRKTGSRVQLSVSLPGCKHEKVELSSQLLSVADVHF